MIISMCEEVQSPATQVPKAMVLTICINTFGGLLFLVPLMFVLPDLAELVALPSGQPVPTIIKSAVGSSGGAFALLLPLIILGVLCGTACTTAASRCTWAFSRDGAIPGSKWWKQVNHKLDVPLNAMMLSMVIQIILGVIYFGSTAAFNAFSGVGVICLTCSYATPIAVSMLEGRRQVKTGKFYLGKLGWFCNIVALGMFSLSASLLTLQPGRSLLCLSSACRRTSPLPPFRSTMPPSSSSPSSASLPSGTSCGVASTTMALLTRTCRWTSPTPRAHLCTTRVCPTLRRSCNGQLDFYLCFI